VDGRVAEVRVRYGVAGEEPGLGAAGGVGADRADYGDRKRNTASALVWIKLTHGEHLFAPHRRSAPGYRPGSVQDRGLSIDRAWWRARNDHADRHYPSLDRICARLADSMSGQIDHARS